MQIEPLQSDLLEIEHVLIRATAGKRFLNYIIDLIVFIILFVGIGIIFSMFTPAFDDFLEWDKYGFVTTLLYALYMGIIVVLFKGKSFGKFATKTRAVNLDGTNISIGTAFGRGFARIAPFCAFSAFGNPCNPWQDRWTNTIVIAEIFG